ncbi:cysteine--tRNA ligase, partial [bacterium]|nr:cysteine--tRNA ligase [bacterium]
MQNLRLFDSNRGEVQPFKSLTQGKVKMYVCGVTPYATNHLGHIFVFTHFDILWRVLELLEYDVKYVQNVTDIDQPLFKKAREEGKDWKDLAQYWVDYMLEDFNSLGIKRPNNFIYASDNLDSMIKVIERLVEKGYGYSAGGNIYFDTKKYNHYGDNIKADYAELLELSGGEYGGQDNSDPNKIDPLDFPLWIGEENMEKEDPKFLAPWGSGMPGWHIECSSMIIKHLGEQIDIHGGGYDLRFPHHGAEIAQSQAYSGKKPFVNFWMHAAMVKYEGHKISKSRGNLVSVQEIIQQYDPKLLRFYLAINHYREEWEFSYESLDAAKEKFEQIETSIQKLSDTKITKQEILGSELLQSTMLNDLNIGKLVDQIE